MFKKILSDFVDFGESKETPQSNTVNQVASTPSVEVKPNIINTERPKEVGQEVVNYVNTVLYKDINKQNYIFFSLENIVETLKQSGLSEGVAYSSAFLALKSTNIDLSKTTLTRSVVEYTDALKKNAVVINNKCLELENNELKDTVNTVNNLKLKIKETEKLLSELNNQLSSEENNLREAESSIAEIRNALSLVTNNYTNELSSKLNKIETLIA